MNVNMNGMKYISPTSLSLYLTDKREFYIKYVLRSYPRIPQTIPMGFGSAFDAYVKAALAEDLGMDDPSLKLDYLLEVQLEDQVRDACIPVGARLLERYRALGSYANLLKELAVAGKVDFESTVQATCRLGRKDIPILGKPDLYYWSEGVLHIYDWKVNGMNSSRTTSPNKGYKLLVPGYKVHKGYNVKATLDELNPTWARQILLYGWCLGAVDVVAGIEQLVGPIDAVRCAVYRCGISDAFVLQTIEDCCRLWHEVTTDTVLDAEEAAELRLSAGAFVQGGGDNEDWYNSIAR